MTGDDRLPKTFLHVDTSVRFKDDSLLLEPLALPAGATESIGRGQAAILVDDAVSRYNQVFGRFAHSFANLPGCQRLTEHSRDLAITGHLSCRNLGYQAIYIIVEFTVIQTGCLLDRKIRLSCPASSGSCCLLYYTPGAIKTGGDWQGMAASWCAPSRHFCHNTLFSGTMEIWTYLTI
jgi:hypothetical protein